jgi:hypothetical protein
LHSHIKLTASSYMTKNLRISSYIRKPYVIYDFATAPFWISLNMKIFYTFYWCKSSTQGTHFCYFLARKKKEEMWQAMEIMTFVKMKLERRTLSFFVHLFGCVKSINQVGKCAFNSSLTAFNCCYFYLFVR